MKNLFFLCLFIIFLTKINFSQYLDYMQDDLVLESTQQATKTTTGTMTVATSTGHFNTMVLMVGFPDRNTAWPTITNKNGYPDELFPKLGTFPDGTYLRDYIDTNGPVNVEDWYGAGIEEFFNRESNGKCTTTLTFPKKTDGSVYTTTHNFTYWVPASGDLNNVIYSLDSNYVEMTQEAVSNLYNDDPTAFTGIDMLCVVFVGITGHMFSTQYSGIAYGDITFTHSTLPGVTVFSGQYNIQKTCEALCHEILHLFGPLVTSTSGFNGLPDRGNNRYVEDERYHYHHNITWGHDIMYHNGQLPALTSLYGLPPMLSHDKIQLGWIEPSEIIEINYTDIPNVKLIDVNKELTATDIAAGKHRIAKVIIHENHNTTGLDEYFLIEYHAGSGFDRNYHNDYEGGVFTGILIWHIKELTTDFNNGVNDHDNIIDLEAAIPYNGWDGRTPQPDDSYPRDYVRWDNYNFVSSREYDYLDDNLMAGYTGVFFFLPDGGKHIWEDHYYAATNPYPWDPTRTWFYRTQPMKSDFYSDDVLQGISSNKFTPLTYPSTCDWRGNPTDISILNITRESGYMSLSVNYNTCEGEIENGVILRDTVNITGDVIIPSGKTLTVPAGIHLVFKNNSSLIVNGTLNVEGTSSNKVNLNFSGSNLSNGGVKIYSSGSADIDYAVISNANYGIYSESDNVTIANTKITSCNHGIYLDNSSPSIENCLIQNNRLQGLYAESYSSPELSRNTIKDNGSWGIYGLGHSYIDLTSYNLITGNSSGILLRYYSESYAGYVSGPGFSSIYSNTGYEFQAVLSSNADLRTVYWGSSSGPSASDFSVDAGSSYDYTPYLNSNYSAGSSLSKASVEVTDYDLANEYYSKGDYESAKKLFKQIIKENERKDIAMFALEGLNRCYIKDKQKGCKDYLQKELKTKTRSKNDKFELQILELETYWYLQEGDIESAIQNYDYILENFTNNEDAIKFNLYNKGKAYLNYAGDKEKAAEVFGELKSKYPDDMLAALCDEALNNSHQIKSSGYLEKEDNEITSEEEVVISDYGLSENYPNPFNPTTTISYQIPEAGFVTLKVFDMLGREVANLVNKKMEAGKYSANFNASNLASGIYIYRITVQSFEGSKDFFTQSNKMLLLK